MIMIQFPFRLTFDKNGIAKCPYCPEYVNNFNKFCGHCGKKLPSPPKKDNCPNSDPGSINHLDFEVLNKKFDEKFCTQCGKKL